MIPCLCASSVTLFGGGLAGLLAVHLDVLLDLGQVEAGHVAGAADKHLVRPIRLLVYHELAQDGDVSLARVTRACSSLAPTSLLFLDGLALGHSAALLGRLAGSSSLRSHGECFLENIVVRGN